MLTLTIDLLQGRHKTQVGHVTIDCLPMSVGGVSRARVVHLADRLKF